VLEARDHHDGQHRSSKEQHTHKSTLHNDMVPLNSIESTRSPRLFYPITLVPN